MYHFLSTNDALSDLALKRIKLSRIGELNDPFELLAAALVDKGQRGMFRRFKDEANRRVGVLCFSKEWTHPILWSHYADRHRGVCLGFDVPDRHLHRVEYLLNRLRVDLERLKDLNGNSEGLAVALLRRKYSGWRYEKEVRLILPLRNGMEESGLYFRPFDMNLVLKEVIIGYCCGIPIGRVRELVSQVEGSAKVVKARLAFRKFKIVEDRKATKEQ